MIESYFYFIPRKLTTKPMLKQKKYPSKNIHRFCTLHYLIMQQPTHCIYNFAWCLLDRSAGNSGYTVEQRYRVDKSVKLLYLYLVAVNSIKNRRINIKLNYIIEHKMLTRIGHIWFTFEHKIRSFYTNKVYYITKNLEW